MNSISWTPFAFRCLDEIHQYILDESKSKRVADNFIERIYQRTNQLKEFPESGQEEFILKENGRNARYILEGFYKIVYTNQAHKNEVIIIDIFHTSQDPIKLTK